MFMKTNAIFWLTWNVLENKRVVRSLCEEVDSRLRGNDRCNVLENKRVDRGSWSVSRPWPDPHVWEPRMFMKTNEIVEITGML